MEAILQPGDHREGQGTSLSHPLAEVQARGYGRDPVTVEQVPRLLLKERIIFIPPIISDAVANEVVKLLLYLDSQDTSKDIHMYINCHGSGGIFYFGLGIYDTMQYIKSDVSTYCVGVANGIAAAFLAGGTKGKRFCLPHAQVTLHQPTGTATGQASDIAIRAREAVRQRQLFCEILAKHTGKTSTEIQQDSDRRHYLTAQQAMEYGLVDDIIYPEDTGARALDK